MTCQGGSASSGCVGGVSGRGVPGLKESKSSILKRVSLVTQARQADSSRVERDSIVRDKASANALEIDSIYTGLIVMLDYLQVLITLPNSNLNFLERV